MALLFSDVATPILVLASKWSIVYIERVRCYSFEKIFYSFPALKANNTDPDNAAVHLGLSCLPKYTAWSH